MRLGTRWSFGTTPTATLPTPLLLSIQEAEQSIIDAGITAGDWGWTLTWLEGAPIAELDNGLTLRYEPHTESVNITPAE